MLDFTPLEAHVGIHHIPLISFKAIVRQHFVRRLNIFLAFLLFGTFGLLRTFPGIDTNQRAEIGEAQLT
ncbi:hypothetical protein D3C85_1410970 [compost metagenome]